MFKSYAHCIVGSTVPTERFFNLNQAETTYWTPCILVGGEKRRPLLAEPWTCVSSFYVPFPTAPREEGHSLRSQGVLLGDIQREGINLNNKNTYFFVFFKLCMAYKVMYGSEISYWCEFVE